MFNLFDEDGNGNINIDELLSMMAFFIEIGMDTGNVDMAKTMAEVFQKGDKNKDEKLSKAEFLQVTSIIMDKTHNHNFQGMTQHPVTANLLKVKTIDALLATF